MYANLIMAKNVMTCQPDQTVAEVIGLLNGKTCRIIPVVDDKHHILGAVNTLTLLAHIVPEYIVDGYLQSVPFVPDIGVLHKHYREILQKNITEVMDDDPTLVRENESLLSVAASMVTHDRFEYVLVVDGEQHLAGVISSSDILMAMDQFIPKVAPVA